ncbi:MAG: biopolymer transporter ExbD [Pirellulales bacterium]|nr:biopolymer transporter ExbD [Pirellulales bacterium]
MALDFSCPHCRKPLTAAAEHAGATIKCAGCGRMVEIPRPPAVDEEPETVKLKVKREENDDVDMTPMIDCVFLLLIFFLVTASLALQKSKEIPPPEQKESTQARTVEEIEDDPNNVVVRIDKDNTVWVGDVEAPSEQDLLVKLREARETPLSQGKRCPDTLIVLADGEAVLEIVVRVLDAGTAVGMEHVRLAESNEGTF